MAINSVHLTGNLARDPEVRYENVSKKANARITIAVDRGRSSKGDPLGVDYPQVVFWGGPAEYIEKYLRKGMKVSIEGKLRTGKYESRRTGQAVYYTEIQGDKIEAFRVREEQTAKDQEHPDAPSAVDVTGDDTWSSQESMDFVRDDDIPF